MNLESGFSDPILGHPTKRGAGLVPGAAGRTLGPEAEVSGGAPSFSASHPTFARCRDSARLCTFARMLELSKIALVFGLMLTAACGSDAGDDDNCAPDDADGIVGGINKVLLNVSDTGFAVGGVNSGSTQPNIAVQNTSTVKLTVTNVGTTPHSFQVACIPSELPAACPQTSCFPDAANIPAIAPGDSVTVEFKTPVVEGAYEFTSNEAGDEALVGQFVLM